MHHESPHVHVVLPQSSSASFVALHLLAVLTTPPPHSPCPCSAWLSHLPTQPFPTPPTPPTLFIQVYCLPDNYEVADRSLDDVRHVLNPTFAPGEISRLDKDVRWARTLDGEYTHDDSMHSRGWRMLQLVGAGLARAHALARDDLCVACRAKQHIPPSQAPAYGVLHAWHCRPAQRECHHVHCSFSPCLLLCC